MSTQLTESTMYVLDSHSKAECEAGAMRELLEECLAHMGSNINFWPNLQQRVRNLLNCTDLGELTANQIRELRDQVKQLKSLIEAQSLGIQSLSAQNKWLRTWKDVAMPLLNLLCWTSLSQAPIMDVPADEVRAKCRNLLTAQYEGTRSDYADLLSMAVCIELIPGKLELVKEDEKWHLYFSQGVPATLEDSVWLREGFPTLEAAYSFFLSTPEILKAVRK